MLFILPIHYCLDYGRVIGAEVDEAMGYAKFPNSFEEGVRGGVPCIVLAVTARVALRALRTSLEWNFKRQAYMLNVKYSQGGFSDDKVTRSFST